MTPFIWFDKLTTGFDKPVLSKVEGLGTNGSGVKNVDETTCMVSLSNHAKLSSHRSLTLQPVQGLCRLDLQTLSGEEVGAMMRELSNQPRGVVGRVETLAK